MITAIMVMAAFSNAANAGDYRRSKSAETTSVEGHHKADVKEEVDVWSDQTNQRRGSTSTGAMVWSVFNASPMDCPTKIPPVSTTAKQLNPRMSPAAMRMEIVVSALRCSVLKPI